MIVEQDYNFLNVNDEQMEAKQKLVVVSSEALVARDERNKRN
jgi:hypothetical protein